MMTLAAAWCAQAEDYWAVPRRGANLFDRTESADRRPDSSIPCGDGKPRTTCPRAASSSASFGVDRRELGDGPTPPGFWEALERGRTPTFTRRDNPIFDVLKKALARGTAP